MTAPGRKSRVAGAAVSILLAAVTFLLYRDYLPLSQLGHDSYPIILASKIEGGADLAGTFTEELMDGRYPKGHFYRPALNLSFALDHALYGLQPFGYHLTDMAILAVTAALLARLLPALCAGALYGVAGFAAALFFLVHPVQMNVLPVPPRRGDTLTLLFMLLALHSSMIRAPWKRAVAVAVFTLLSVASKETGAITPLLLFAWRFLHPDGAGRSRWRGAVSLSLPSFAALVPFIVARQAVIGGLGGHMELSIPALAKNALFILPEFLRGTFYPYPFLAGIVPGPIVSLILPATLLLFCMLLFRRSDSAGAALFTIVWALFGWAIHAFSGSISPWYVVHTVVPLSLLAGLIARETILRFAGKSFRPASAIPLGATALILLLFAVNLRGAPLFRFHPEWHDLSLLTERFIEKANEAVATTPDGSTATLDGLPYGTIKRPGSPIVIAAGLADYTVQAWAELVHPDRKIRVAYGRSSPPPPAPDELLLVVRVGRERRR